MLAFTAEAMASTAEDMHVFFKESFCREIALAGHAE